MTASQTRQLVSNLSYTINNTTHNRTGYIITITGIVQATWTWLLAALSILMIIGADPRIQQGINTQDARTAQTTAAVDTINITATVGPIVTEDGRVVQGKTTTCKATLTYTVENNTYTLSTSAAPDPNSPRKTPALCKAHKGDQLTVLYNPQRPASAQAAVPTSTSAIDMRTLIEGAVFAAIGIAGLIAVFIIWRRRRQ